MKAFRLSFPLGGLIPALLPDGGSGPDERVDFLTRQSPKPPDWETLLYAFAAFFIALVLISAWKLRKKERELNYRTLFAALAVASFIGAGLFLVNDLVPHLSEEHPSFTREPFGEVKPASFEAFVRELDRRIPEGDGLMLINCDPRSNRRADTINYFLYPRRVIFRRQSLLPVEDPAAFLNGDILDFIRSEGAAWLLDMRPEKIKAGAGAALIPLPSKEASEGGKGDG